MFCTCWASHAVYWYNLNSLPGHKNLISFVLYLLGQSCCVLVQPQFPARTQELNELCSVLAGTFMLCIGTTSIPYSLPGHKNLISFVLYLLGQSCCVLVQPPFPIPCQDTNKKNLISFVLYLLGQSCCVLVQPQFPARTQELNQLCSVLAGPVMLCIGTTSIPCQHKRT